MDTQAKFMIIVAGIMVLFMLYNQFKILNEPEKTIITKPRIYTYSTECKGCGSHKGRSNKCLHCGNDRSHHQIHYPA